MPPPLNVDHVIEARKPPPDINNLSSDQAATAQRDYLTYLLQRALKQVPFVKLDSVDACITALNEAVELLESNIDESIPVPSNIESLVSPPQASLEDLRFRSREISGPDFVDDKDNIHVSNQQNINSDHTTTHHDDTNSAIILSQPAKPVSAGATEEKDSARYVANKLLGVAVTRDYSSPRSAARSLGSNAGQKDDKQSKNKQMIGLGGNKNVSTPTTSAPTFDTQRSQSSGSRPSSRAQGAMQSSQTLQQQFTHKPSSRAQQAIIPNDNDNDNDNNNEYDTQSQDINDSNLTSDELRGVARPLSNKLLNRVGGGSKEFPSPKLGPRSIGASRSSSGNTPNTQLENKQQQLLQINTGRSASVPQGRLGLGNNNEDNNNQSSSTTTSSSSIPAVNKPHSISYDTDNTEPIVESVSPIDYTEKDSDSEESDHIVASMTHADVNFDINHIVKKDPVSQLKAQVPVPVTASPKQYKSSLALLEMAKKSHEQQDDITNSDTDILHTQPLQSSQLNRLTESAIDGSGSPGNSTNGTPKPAWLRRLDSPLTHHGKLMQAKGQMHQLLKRAMVAASRVKHDKLHDATDVVTKALDKLEQSTTIAASNSSTLPQIPNL